MAGLATDRQTNSTYAAGSTARAISPDGRDAQVFGWKTQNGGTPEVIDLDTDQADATFTTEFQEGDLPSDNWAYAAGGVYGPPGYCDVVAAHGSFRWQAPTVTNGHCIPLQVSNDGSIELVYNTDASGSQPPTYQFEYSDGSHLSLPSGLRVPFSRHPMSSDGSKVLVIKSCTSAAPCSDSPTPTVDTAYVRDRTSGSMQAVDLPFAPSAYYPDLELSPDGTTVLELTGSGVAGTSRYGSLTVAATGATTVLPFTNVAAWDPTLRTFVYLDRTDASGTCDGDLIWYDVPTGHSDRIVTLDDACYGAVGTTVASDVRVNHNVVSVPLETDVADIDQNGQSDVYYLRRTDSP